VVWLSLNHEKFSRIEAPAAGPAVAVMGGMLKGRSGSSAASWLVPALMTLGVIACQPGQVAPEQPPSAPAPVSLEEATALASELDQALAAACPMAVSGDDNAHQACADALVDLPVLRARMAASFDWGGQSATDSRAFESANRTDFNPRIWRRLYLPTFMFPGGHAVELAGDTAIIRIPVVFRTDLDPGNFPYPFWHSAAKWQSYQTATDILFYLRGGKLIGALRSAEQDATRPRREMKWDGRWTWQSNRGDEPRVTLFSFAFSPDNPRVNELERAYRAMEKELRKESCLGCHSPDNTARMNPLELFSYPNQALSGRHQLIKVLDENTMPPVDAIPDSKRRSDLRDLAQAFSAAGDAALDFEDNRADGK
jgi:hypothetical protein